MDDHDEDCSDHRRKPGLGFEIARRLGRSGAKTIIGARDAANGKQAAQELRGEGLDAASVAIDVNSASSVQAAAKQVEEEHGRLDILINNAGILPEATAGETAGPLDLRMFRETFRDERLRRGHGDPGVLGVAAHV